MDEATFKECDRLGYGCEYIGRFAEFFTAYDFDEVDHGHGTSCTGTRGHGSAR